MQEPKYHIIRACWLPDGEFDLLVSPYPPYYDGKDHPWGAYHPWDVTSLGPFKPGKLGQGHYCPYELRDIKVGAPYLWDAPPFESALQWPLTDA